MNIVFRYSRISLLLAWSCIANADLTDIGDGLIYDDYLDVTWMQDANYMQASGAHPDGRVSWTDAHAYTESLEYVYGAQNVVLKNWRLPSAFNLGTSYICTEAPCNQSEFGHLQHVDGFGLFLSVGPTNVVVHWTNNSFGSGAYLYNHALGKHYAAIKDPVYKPNAWLLMDGDAREAINDGDEDGVSDSEDNCPSVPNADQLNTDGANDGGDACDDNDDNDTWEDFYDNCPLVANLDQADGNEDGIGDACDLDDDGIPGDLDNCPLISNADQIDTDGDGTGNACEGLPPGC